MDQMSKHILFVFFPLYVKWSHGIALLSAICKLQGIKTSLYLLDTHERFKKYLEDNPCDYLGFSCVCVHDYLLSKPFMETAKEMGKIILLGGVYPRHGSYIDAPVDYICRGDGEMLPNFLTTGNTELFDEVQIRKNLNDLPLPDYDLFQGIPYNRELPFAPEIKNILSYHSSRGCPYQCSFCEVVYQPQEVRFRTMVGEDLSYLVDRYKPEMVLFGDELLPYYYEPWRESWGDFKFPFVAYIRADISESLLIWLHDRGLKGCFFGIESADETYRNEVLGKKLSDAALYRTVNLLKDMGIPFMVAYMRGTPGETWPMQAQTEKLCRTIGGYPIIYQYEDLTRI